MIGDQNYLRNAVSLFRDPVTAEKRRILDERWAGLTPEVKVFSQGLGQKATGCGATIGIQPRCDFACTGCYLGDEANRIPALPTDAILRQLDELRRYLGPKSNVQITDGEVTLRPEEELIEILRYARSIGVIPMVMTHGDNFRRKPGLLERLIVEGFLTEVSIHVDITQRGRDGYRSPKDENELTPLRDEFATMIREARRTTGRRLRAAMTMTVTQQNLPQIADVSRWLIRNRDAFSLVSFQPLAQVGRTRKSLMGVSAEELWTEVDKALQSFGVQLQTAEPIHFGHPECTRFVPYMIVEEKAKAPRLMQLIRDNETDRTLLERYMKTGLAGVAFRDDLPIEMVARGAGMMRHSPRFVFGEGKRWIVKKIREELGYSIPALLARLATGRAKLDGFTFTSHHFMNPLELETDLGKARLDACVFRLPVNGEMKPMCQVNAGGVRERFYADIPAKTAAAEPHPA